VLTFAVHSTLTIYYSLDQAPLEQVIPAIQNDNSGGGQYQIGILKKSTGTSDVVHSGYQESGIYEGQIYGGLFVEDSACGCVSL
jgi:Glycoside hydrolase 131 catalytic N-terminal domain